MAECVFCSIAAGAAPAATVLEDESFMAFLDIRPVFHGHVLVVPRAHHETLLDLPPELVEPLFARVRLVTAAVWTALDAQGAFNAINNVVSQSVPHLHVHVIPRRFKDGLRGFMWPRQPYRDDAHLEEVRALIAARIEG